MQNLKVIAANRRTLRQLGLTSCAISFVEKYVAMKLRNPRVTLASVCRVLGYNRSLGTKYMKKAEEIGLVARLRRTFVVNARWLAGLSKVKIKQMAYVRKVRKTLAEFSSVNRRSTHSRTNIFKGTNRLNQSDLKVLVAPIEGYVPLHLRKCRE